MADKLYKVARVFPKKWRVVLPPSKSLSNRAILLASLTEGKSSLLGLSKSKDTKHMTKVCHKLGAKFCSSLDKSEIIGFGSKVKSIEDYLYMGNAGTTLRFVLPILLFGKGVYKVFADHYMNLRPHHAIINCLEQVGLKVKFLEKVGFTPFEVSGQVDVRNLNTLLIDCEQSSQFLSSLLMVSPLFKCPFKIKSTKKTVSFPYVSMTLNMMRRFGVEVEENAGEYFFNGVASYKPVCLTIEPDASSASYFLALAAISAGEITLPFVPIDSYQGDWGFAEILEKMGCFVKRSENELFLRGSNNLKAITVDMVDMPDIVPSLVSVCAVANGVSKIYNISHLRFKECDRLSALVEEFKKLGVIIYEKENILWVEGGKLHRAVCDSHGDHRIAMSLSILGSQIGGVEISNYDCVDKSYPGFYQDLQKCSN
jgi:3-phosphoshikimate 1-carboxyvinyltransferase